MHVDRTENSSQSRQVKPPVCRGNSLGRFRRAHNSGAKAIADGTKRKMFSFSAEIIVRLE